MNTDPKKIIRRKTLLINPRFQLDFIGKILGLLFVMIAILAVVLNWQYSPLVTQIENLELVAHHPLVIELNVFKKMMIVSSILTAASLFFICCAAGLLISHKVAGPLHRLKKHLMRMRDLKEITPLNFRKNDYFSEIADDFNSFLDIVEVKKGQVPVPLSETEEAQE